jgi:hypothetical protein
MMRKERIQRYRDAMRAGDDSITESRLQELNDQLQLARYQTLVERGQVLPGITEVPRNMPESGSSPSSAAASGALASAPVDMEPHKHQMSEANKRNISADEYKIKGSATAPRGLVHSDIMRPPSGASRQGIRVSSMRMGSMNPAHEDGMIGLDTGASTPLYLAEKMHDSGGGPSAVRPLSMRVHIKETRLGEAWSSDDEDTAASGIEEEKI